MPRSLVLPTLQFGSFWLNGERGLQEEKGNLWWRQLNSILANLIIYLHMPHVSSVILDIAKLSLMCGYGGFGWIFLSVCFSQITVAIAFLYV